MTLVPPNDCSVLIVGGGPCGLMLAKELGRRGVTAILIDQRPTTAFNPQANATQARTMEHFRRLGFANEIRALGLPPDFPTDIANFTRYARHERRPNAERNTNYARRFADSLGLFVPVAEIEEDSPAGANARRIAGEYPAAHGQAEFDIAGITFGARYYASLIIVADGTEPPPDAANLYVPSACPGGRAPHLWLSGEQSLYDRFGFEWTLLRLSRAAEGQQIAAAAAKLGLELKIVDLWRDDAHDLYQADLALIRPDQFVAWRGNSDEAGAEIIGRVLGF